MESPKPYLFTDNNPNSMEDYALKGEKDRLYIVGSLYLVGQVKAYMRRQTDDRF